MARYQVEIPEVHYSLREVEAEDEAEALEKADDADEIQMEYSHTLDGYRIRKLPDGEWKINNLI